MGQNSPQLKNNSDFQIVSELPIGNIVRDSKAQTLHFHKEYSYTDQQAYQKALTLYAQKLSSKNQHVLNFQHFSTKSQNSFCSTFYKIGLVYEYSQYSLADEINLRIKQQRPFVQKEMWSVLCSCVLAAVHLQRNQGKMHCAITTKDIRLNSNGCVKLLSPQMIGLAPEHTLAQGKPKLLAMAMIESFLLEAVTNQDQFFLENQIQCLDCSQDMKDILFMMIKPKTTFTELQEFLFKLVQEEESVASQSNTPILKSANKYQLQEPAYECPKILRQEESMKKMKNNELSVSYRDYEDSPSIAFNNFSEFQQQNPDQTEQNNDVSPEKTNRMQTYETNLLIKPCSNQQLPIQQSSDNLFTDPSLISLIKNDLEEIRMRKSMGSQSKPQSHLNEEQISININTISREEKINSNLLQIRKDTSQQQFEMIKESSQEYRQESSEERQRQSLRQQFKDVQNIMADTNLGFKKTKRSTTNQYEKISDFKKEQQVMQTHLGLKMEEIPKEKSFNMLSNQSYQTMKKSQEELIHVSEDYAKGRYEGTKLNGKRHGYGTFYYSEGGKYIGQWIENKMHGEGTLYYPNQKIAYKGQWKNDQLQGYGTLYNEQVCMLRTPYDYRDWTQAEDYWVRYEGNFFKDNKEGMGTLYLSNGQKFEGHFHNDMVDGEGTLYRAEGKPVKGKWIGNTLINLF